MPAKRNSGRVVCERLAKSFNEPHQTYDRVSFNMQFLSGWHPSLKVHRSLAATHTTGFQSQGMPAIIGFNRSDIF
jgi:hypothetical protein